MINHVRTSRSAEWYYDPDRPHTVWDGFTPYLGRSRNT